MQDWSARNGQTSARCDPPHSSSVQATRATRIEFLQFMFMNDRGAAVQRNTQSLFPSSQSQRVLPINARYRSRCRKGGRAPSLHSFGPAVNQVRAFSLSIMLRKEAVSA
jgi:hypothetical protein